MGDRFFYRLEYCADDENAVLPPTTRKVTDATGIGMAIAYALGLAEAGMEVLLHVEPLTPEGEDGDGWPDQHG